MFGRTLSTHASMKIFDMESIESGNIKRCRFYFKSSRTEHDELGSFFYSAGEADPHMCTSALDLDKNEEKRACISPVLVLHGF